MTTSQLPTFTVGAVSAPTTVSEDTWIEQFELIRPAFSYDKTTVINLNLPGNRYDGLYTGAVVELAQGADGTAPVGPPGFQVLAGGEYTSLTLLADSSTAGRIQLRRRADLVFAGESERAAA